MADHSFRALRYERPAADPFEQRVTVSGENNPRGEMVLYWAQSARRLRNNPALEYAIAKANGMGLPVVVYESVRPDYPSANDRIHSFVLEGVASNAADASDRGIRYQFFLPRTPAEARGGVRTLASRASLVVTDEFPTSVIATQTRCFIERSRVAVHLFDGNGILPMRAMPKEQYSAKFFRDRAHRLFPDRWPRMNDIEPRHHFAGDLDLPAWDGTDVETGVAGCEIDHSVRPVATRGGRAAALKRLDEFVASGIEGYATMRNRSPKHLSGLSPYLHFGHIGIQEIAERVLESEAPQEDVDSFLEEAIIRRELSFNMCFFNPDFGSLTALPAWALGTLEKHRADRRKPVYSHEELAAAATHDEVWNLAQRQLLVTGTIHGYLRMLWGKKIIEWSETPEEAHETMVRLHDVYAIDGRDPNTYAGVLWCFGKHDRPWAPERPIFGSIRWMSSLQTAKNVRLAAIEESVKAAETAQALKRRMTDG